MEKKKTVEVYCQNTPLSLGKEAIIWDIQGYFYLHS